MSPIASPNHSPLRFVLTLLVASGCGPSSASRATARAQEPGPWEPSRQGNEPRVREPFCAAPRRIGRMGHPRVGHQAARLADGRVLIVGAAGAGGPLGSAEIFDPRARSFRRAAPLPVPVSAFTLTALPDGSALAVGGLRGTTSDTTSDRVHRYDPIADRWIPAASLSVGRYDHTAVLLDDGTVLVVGGSRVDGSTADVAERFQPALGTWNRTGQPDPDWAVSTAIRRHDGSVLAVGGETHQRGKLDTVGRASRYDPAKDVWHPLPEAHPRRFHAGALLDDRRVVVVGGTADYGEMWGIKSIEALSPGAKAWAPLCSIADERQFHPIAIPLPRQRLLVMGGGTQSLQIVALKGPSPPEEDASSESPCLGEVVETPEDFPGEGMTATVLEDGHVLVVGGRLGSGEEGHEAQRAEAFLLGACGTGG